MNNVKVIRQSKLGFGVDMLAGTMIFIYSAAILLNQCLVMLTAGIDGLSAKFSS